MASIVDAFSEALGEDKSLVKVVLYSVPVYYMIKMFMVGKMAEFALLASIVAILFLALLTLGIHNVRLSRKEILSLNPVQLVRALMKSLVVLVPHLIVYGALGYYIVTHVDVPIDLPHVPLIFSVIVWSIIFSIIFTSYLSFAKYLKVVQGYNYVLILESCIDVLVSFLFFIPQLLFANIVLVGPVAYLYYFFHLPFDHWGFMAYCSMVSVINISILANYMAQAAYEQIRGNNEDYDDNYNKPINLIDEAAERLNGN